MSMSFSRALVAEEDDEEGEAKSGEDVALKPSWVLAVRCRRSNSACWSAGRRGGEGPGWKVEVWRMCGGRACLVVLGRWEGRVAASGENDNEGRRCEKARVGRGRRVACILVAIVGSLSLAGREMD